MIYFATGNSHKVHEAQAALPFAIEQAQVDLPEIQSMDTKEVALQKVQAAYEQLQQPIFVDDAGLYLEAYNGFPGTFIKHLLSTKGTQGILDMMHGQENRIAEVRLAIAYHDGKNPHVFEGIVKGSIALEIHGDNGFGFDPVFIPQEATKSYAQMTTEEKTALSHRGKALGLFAEFIQASS